MSDGQSEACELNEQPPKIDPRLIADELQWRGKEVEVLSANQGWIKRVFHTATKEAVWCFGDSLTGRLFAWSTARIPEKKWRTPTDADAVKRPKCRVRQLKDDEWREGVLHFIKPSYAAKYVVECEGSILWQQCQIEDDA
jgi:hypothetical protein